MSIQIGTWLLLGLISYLVLVAFHMLGHLLTSRVLNIGIEVASFGVGPKLFQLWRTKLLWFQKNYHPVSQIESGVFYFQKLQIENFTMHYSIIILQYGTMLGIFYQSSMFP
jgi:hypothetical protein